MAKIAVYDIQSKPGLRAGARRCGIRCRRQGLPDSRYGPLPACGAPSGNRGHQDPQRGVRRRQRSLISRRVPAMPARDASALLILSAAGRLSGPTRGNYGFKLNRKVKRAALKSALSVRFKEEKLTVLNAFDLERSAPRAFAEILEPVRACQGFWWSSTGPIPRWSSRPATCPTVKVLQRRRGERLRCA